MNDGSEIQPRRLPPWLKFGLVLLGLVVVLCGAIHIMGRFATSRWNSYAASLRAKGHLLTFEEIEAARAVVPKELNGARIIEDNFNGLNRIDDVAKEHNLEVLFVTTMGDRDRFFDGLPRGLVQSTREYLRLQEGLLAKLAPLTDRPSGRFSIQYGPNPYAFLVPHITTVRGLGRLLRAQTAVHLIEGNIFEAVKTIELQCNVANTLHDEPFSISQLVAMAVRADAIFDIENLLRVSAPDEQTLVQLTKLLDRLKSDDRFVFGILGERASIVSMHDQVATGQAPVAAVTSWARGGFTGGVPWLPVLFVRASQLKAAQMMTRLVDAANDPMKLIQETRAVDSEAGSLSHVHFLTKILMPSITRAAELHTRLIAQLEAARAAIACERFRLKNGALPESLAVLVPEFLDAVPLDPFDGQPLRFVTTSEGLIVYSIGENGIDDGGLEEPTSNRGPKDVRFRLHKPDLRGVKLVDDPPKNEEEEEN